MTSESTFQPVKSADRALAVLERLAATRSRRTLSELSRELNIPISSLHSILRTLQRRMWVEADETGTRFGIGVQALTVGSAYVQTDDVVARAQPVLDWLNEQTGETVHYGRLEGSHIVYLAKRESHYQLRIYSAVGRRIPAHATALGKAILAEYGDDEVRGLLTWPLPTLTSKTRSDAAALLRDLATARRLGYATEKEESDTGLGCLAVAVPDWRRVRDAISLAVPTARLGRERRAELAELLLTARNTLRERMTGQAREDGGFLRILE
ncbi:IclR family transcriptional regulator [Streptomyces sp. NPDC050560]|uniref:IclR family transcriptional regulator n=1 Tax=Streptomyces sp. NPDC050560 TaxID=3365630 RepID=UPI0037AAC475